MLTRASAQACVGRDAPFNVVCLGGGAIRSQIQGSRRRDFGNYAYNTLRPRNYYWRVLHPAICSALEAPGDSGGSIALCRDRSIR